MNTPLVSIIMPVYNAGRFVGECVDSVLAQDMPDWELLVVDDGSTDDSAAIVAARMAAAGGRLRLLSQPNSGVSAARNRALDEARGRYVMFVAADDVLPPGALSAYADAVRALGVPDMLRCEYTAVDAAGAPLFASKAAMNTRGGFVAIDSAAFYLRCVRSEFFLWLLWVRRECIGTLRFVAGRAFMEDAEFLLRLAPAAGRCAYTSGRLYLYRKYSEAASARLTAGKAADVCAIIRRICGLVADGGCAPAALDAYMRATARFCMEVLQGYVFSAGPDGMAEAAEAVQAPAVAVLCAGVCGHSRADGALARADYAAFARLYRRRRLWRACVSLPRRIFNKLLSLC
ncbi:MAG: glycosyltransferase family 2 protein [Muribaculaceae bacterium]|nr:glycosyltransferase family 2 protein [Muribaculaceae bacterium]